MADTNSGHRDGSGGGRGELGGYSPHWGHARPPSEGEKTVFGYFWH